VRSPAALERSPPGFVALARVGGAGGRAERARRRGDDYTGRIFYSPPISVANLCHMVVVADSLAVMATGRACGQREGREGAVEPVELAR
jgi:hypothetical protein